MENQIEKLKNQYPLNTFKGETHKELVNLIGLVIFNEREVVRKSIIEEIEGILEKYRQNNDGTTLEDMLIDLISIINEHK